MAERVEGRVVRHRRKPFPCLCNHTYRWYDPFKPQFYTQIKIEVPAPQKGDDLPCCLVYISNARDRILIRFSDPAEVARILNIPPADYEALCQSWKNAIAISAIRKSMEEQADIKISNQFPL